MSGPFKRSPRTQFHSMSRMTPRTRLHLTSPLPYFPLLLLHHPCCHLRIRRAIMNLPCSRLRRPPCRPRQYLRYLYSLTAIDGHDCQYFNELRARVVSPRIFVRYQRLMARKIAQLFGLNRGVRPFYSNKVVIRE